MFFTVEKTRSTVINMLFVQSIILVFMSFGIQAAEKFEGNYCYLKNGSLGICKKITYCENQAKEAHEGNRNNLSDDRCNFDNFTEIVCCAKESGSYRPAEVACLQYEHEVSNSILPKAEVHHISAGLNTTEEEFPYMVALGYKTEPGDPSIIKYYCGGTLISPKHVLTAAHCVNNIYERVPFQVRLGTNNLEVENPSVRYRSIVSIRSDPRYQRSANYHDIAILTMNESLPINRAIRPICLESEPMEYKNLQNSLLIVTGWGATNFDEDSSSLLLKSPNLTMVDRNTCQEIYSGQSKLPNGLGEGMLCVVDPNITRGSDACQGDSGGPLLLISNVPTVTGITSFGKSCGSSIPAIYTSVFKYLDWIEKIVWPEMTHR